MYVKVPTDTYVLPPILDQGTKATCFLMAVLFKTPSREILKHQYM